MQRVLAIYIPFLATDRLRESPDVLHKRQWPTHRGAESDASSIDNRQSTIGNLDNCQSTIDHPAATISPQGQTLRIVHVNQAARDSYVRPGQTLAEAKAVVPNLFTFPDDPMADRTQMETLAVWAQCFSPTVHIEGADTLLLDVTGCERLFGGDAKLLQMTAAGLADQGFQSRVAIADTPGAAWALAHAHREPLVTATPGRDVALLAPLPIWALRIQQKTVDALGSVGVETIESLLHIPRSSLASRFGDEALRQLDQALGDLPEPLTPYCPQPAMIARLDFGGTTDRREVLLEAVRQATARFCEQLNAKTAGVRQLFITFYSPNVPTDSGVFTRRTTISVSLSHATRSAGHLLTLLKVRLEELRLPAPAAAIAVWSRQVEPLDDDQIELFDTGGLDAKSVGDLLDRLIVRLGHESVVRPQLLSDHQPEKAYRYVSVINAETLKRRNVKRKGSRDQGIEGSRKSDKATKRRSDGGKKNRDREPQTRRSGQAAIGPVFQSTVDNRQSTIHKSLVPLRPLQLLPRPCVIATTSLVPDGPPVAFQWQSKRHEIVDCLGPERIETGWWRGSHIQRDYFRVATDSGRRCWLFRDRIDGKWFLHGWFD